MRVLYKPQTVADWDVTHRRRIENDAKLVKRFQQQEAERRAIKIHKLYAPWAITFLLLAGAGFCYLVKDNHWWGVR